MSFTLPTSWFVRDSFREYFTDQVTDLSDFLLGEEIHYDIEEDQYKAVVIEWIMSGYQEPTTDEIEYALGICLHFSTVKELVQDGVIEESAANFMFDLGEA